MWTATEMRRKRFEAGLCTGCGKGPPRKNRSTCEVCFSKQRERNRRKDEREGKETVGSGAHFKKWEYVAYDGNRVIKRGSAKELAVFLGMTPKNVYEYAYHGRQRRKNGCYIRMEALTSGNQNL